VVNPRAPTSVHKLPHAFLLILCILVLFYILPPILYHPLASCSPCIPCRISIVDLIPVDTRSCVPLLVRADASSCWYSAQIFNQLRQCLVPMRNRILESWFHFCEPEVDILVEVALFWRCNSRLSVHFCLKDSIPTEVRGASWLNDLPFGLPNK